MLKFKIAEDTIELCDTEKSRCVIWAMFITAYAREKLYKCIDALGVEHFLYTDTDSIFTDLDDVELKKRFDDIGEEIDDKKLGAWAIEGFSPYFKMIRAKCYLKTDNQFGKNNDYILKYVIAGYNGNDLLYGYDGKNIKDIPEEDLLKCFNDFKIGRKVSDKETSVQCDYGIKQVKILTDYDIKDKISNYEFIL